VKSVFRGISAVSLCALVLLAVQCGSDKSSPIQVPPPGQCSSTTNPSQVLTSSPAIVPLVKLSADTFTNATSQHATEVEPDSYVFGSTIIAAFQVGRISDGGAADIGYAISTDGGATWQSGLLPGITTFECSGKNSAVSDTAVVYDAAHTTWLIASLPISSTNIQVAVNRRRRNMEQSGHRRERGESRQGLDHLRQHRDEPFLRPLLCRVGRQRQRKSDLHEQFHRRWRDVVHAGEHCRKRQRTRS
jgi:hypothetical protein